MGNTVEELKKKNDNNTNTINTGPVHSNRSGQDNQLGPIRRIDEPGQINQIDQINIGPINQQRSRVAGDQLSSLTLFRDAIVINENREEIGQLILPAEPRLGDIKTAREHADFTLSDSPRERNRILEESKKKRRLTIQARSQNQDNIPLMRHPLTEKDALKLSDEKLLLRSEQMNLNSTYVKARLDLIKNRYYALLPEKEVKKLSNNEILTRLRKLYLDKGAKRDTDLINFYQNMLMIRNHEKELMQKKSKDELRINIDAEKRAEITPAKEAGINSVIEWMKRNCDKSSISKASFVKRVERTSKAKQLLMFYLVEKGLQAAPSDEYCYNALEDYVPDISKIKGQVVASKWKFWKRIGTDSSDSVIDWSRLGMAAHFAIKCDIADTIIENERAIKEADGEERIDETDEEKRTRLMSDLEKKGELILTLYRSAGLSPEMPADIIENKKLRERLISLIASFNEDHKQFVGMLNDIDDNNNLKETLQRKAGEISKEVLSGKKQSKGITASMEKYSKTVSGVVNQLVNTDNMLQYEIDKTNPLEMTDTSVAVVSGISGVLAGLQLVSNFKTAVGIATTASKLTTADHAAKSLSVAGSIVKNAGDLSTSTTTVAQYFQGASVYTPQTSWIGETSVKSLGEHFSDISGGVKFCAGCASIVAGTLNMVAGGIELGRSVSSRHDIKNAEEKLKEIPKNRKTEDHEKLERFLSHEKRVLKNNDISAGVKAATGFLTLAGGILTVTGILAPIGSVLSLVGTVANLGYNLFYARHRRNLARKQAVDDALKLDLALKKIRTQDKKKKKPEYDEFSDDVLRTVIRQEELAELGYATYKEFFSDICKENALMFYKHVFEQDKGQGDQALFEDALKSLGLKIKYPIKPGEKPIPGVAAIYAKMMA